MKHGAEQTMSDDTALTLSLCRAYVCTLEGALEYKAAYCGAPRGSGGQTRGDVDTAVLSETRCLLRNKRRMGRCSLQHQDHVTRQPRQRMRIDGTDMQHALR